MNALEKKTVRYEDAAQQETVTGWVCKVCRAFWGKNESAARYCCATEMPCECGGRNTEKGYTCCKACREKKDEERFRARPRVEWDGETPVCLYHDDRYFFSLDDLQDYVYEHDELYLEDLWLELCEPVKPREFEINEFLCDDLPEDEEVDGREIDAYVNAWIKENVGQAWTGTGKVISEESLAKWLPELKKRAG